MQYYYDPNAYKTNKSKQINPPDLTRNKAVRRVANRIGFAFLLGWVSAIVLEVLFLVVLMNFAGAQAAQSISTNPYALLIMQIVLSVIMFVPFFIIAAKWTGTDLKKHLRLKPDKPLFALSAGMICMGLILVCNFISNITVAIFNSFGLTPESFDIPIPNSAGGIVLYIITLSLIPAIVEEFALRGVVLGSLRRFGDAPAVIISALLFALMHTNFVQIPFAFLMGLIFGYLTVATNSILPAFIIHLINNLLAAVISVITEFYGETALIISNICLFLFYIAVGIAGLVLFFSKKLYKSIKPAEEEKTISSAKCSVIFLFTSPTVIITLLFFIGSAIYDLF